MNNIGRYILGSVALVCIAFFAWYFFSVIAYVLVAAVISFIGKPITDILGKVKVKGKKLPGSLKSAIALLTLWMFFIVLFVTLIPLIAGELQNLERISIDSVLSSLEVPLQHFGQTLEKYGLVGSVGELKKDLAVGFSSVIDTSKIGSMFGSIADTVSGVFIALFSITFISFFFLKDSGLFKSMVIALLPERYEVSAGKALDSIQKLLIRYFVGMLLEILGVMALNTLGLWFVGFDISNAVVVGLVAGVLNVIPYIGPLIGVVFGVLIGVITNIDMGFYSEMLPLLLYIILVMGFTQLIDNLIFQPFIYGNSVYAHPLEIFLVILLAGSMAGIPGMILAIPSYTVLRVILKEFFSNYRLVKKITHGLN